MPILVQRMIFNNMLNYVPKSTPLSVRPTVGKVSDQLKKLLVEPDLKKNLMMVCLWCQSFIMKNFNFDCGFGFFRLKRISKNQNLFFSQADKSQLSVLKLLFQMKEHSLVILLQSADYQMIFPLEVIVRVLPEQAGPKIKEYVRTIHERYVAINHK